MGINVREATIEDLPAVVELAATMREESRFKVLSFNADKAYKMLQWCIDNRDGMLLVAETRGEIIGAFAAFAAEQWFSDDRVACDLGLFVKPERRGGKTGGHAALWMLSEYVRWADSQDCTIIQLGITTGIRTEETGQLYERLGFKKMGALYEFDDGGSDVYRC